jgi:FAD/FMN-containing dehydrogenase
VPLAIGGGGKTVRQRQISGEVLTDEASIKSYSADMSHYMVKPMMIAIPTNQDDLPKIIDYAKEEAIPITPRGAGSNQSGSAVGPGIIILFSKVTATLKRQGRRVKVQSGIIHQQLDQKLNVDGLRIPYDPTSSPFCTIGGMSQLKRAV